MDGSVFDGAPGGVYEDGAYKKTMEDTMPNPGGDLLGKAPGIGGRGGEQQNVEPPGEKSSRKGNKKKN